MNRQISIPRLVTGTALFVVLFANAAFFRNAMAIFATDATGYAHVLSLAVVQWGVLMVLLSLLSFRRTVKAVVSVLLMLSAVTAYFMDTYNVIIDRDMLVNLLSTDPAESRDLLTLRLCGYIVLLGVLPAVLVTRLEVRPETPVAALRSRAIMITSSLTLALATMLLSSGFYASFIREHKSLRYYSNPVTPLYAAYKLGRDRMTAAAGPPRPIGEDAHRPAKDVQRELVVMVVGETARADRFGLNGYQRDTTPRLAREHLVSFTHVAACGTSTMVSVPCMFAIYDREDFSGAKARSTENLLDVLQHAGINLLWRDNNSDSKGVATRIRTEDFRTPQANASCDPECRDLGMLGGLQEFIDRQSSGDILIVLHQIGSHGPAYFKRYPPSFRKFQPTCETSQLDACDPVAIGNTYDNTILYTDHFLAEVIDLLRANDEHFETAMLYVSDHGESLGESGLYLHGLPYLIAPQVQTRVPMILWLGSNYDDLDLAMLEQMRDLPLSHDHVFHTLLGLFELRSAVYDGKKDLLQMARARSGARREHN